MQIIILLLIISIIDNTKKDKRKLDIEGIFHITNGNGIPKVATIKQDYVTMLFDQLAKSETTLLTSQISILKRFYDLNRIKSDFAVKPKCNILNYRLECQENSIMKTINSADNDLQQNSISKNLKMEYKFNDFKYETKDKNKDYFYRFKNKQTNDKIKLDDQNNENLGQIQFEDKKYNPMKINHHSRFKLKNKKNDEQIKTLIFYEDEKLNTQLNLYQSIVEIDKDKYSNFIPLKQLFELFKNNQVSIQY